MSTYVLGRVLPIWKGTYDSTEEYNPLDIVLYNGSSYVALKEAQGIAPTNTTYWSLVAQHGNAEMTPEQIAELAQDVYNSLINVGVVIDTDYTHTDNNYTDSDRNTVITIKNNMADFTNVQSDWTQSNTTAKDYIKNKPANLVQDANYTHTDNNFTNALKSKLNNLEAGANANVQSDWNESNTNADSFIKNKPVIPTDISQLTNDNHTVTDEHYTHTDNNYTNAEKDKVSYTYNLIDSKMGVPTVIEETVANGVYTIQNLTGNNIYRLSGYVGTLNIQATDGCLLESVIYFDADENTNIMFPHSMQFIAFQNTTYTGRYMIVVKDNTAIMVRVHLQVLGEWNAETTYYKNDVVLYVVWGEDVVDPVTGEHHASYSENYYKSLTDNNTGNAPRQGDTLNENWEVVWPHPYF